MSRDPRAISINVKILAMTEEQLLVLNALYSIADREAFHLNEIKSFVNGSSISVKSELESLYRQGYICRDRDSIYYTITPSAKEIVEQARVLEKL